METQIFISKTTYNGRLQMYSTIEIPKLKIYGTGCILSHKNEIHKGLINYWIDVKNLDEIKESYITESTDI